MLVSLFRFVKAGSGWPFEEGERKRGVLSYYPVGVPLDEVERERDCLRHSLVDLRAFATSLSVGERRGKGRGLRRYQSAR